MNGPSAQATNLNGLSNGRSRGQVTQSPNCDAAAMGAPGFDFW
jgi:hypothetical protein